MEVAKPAGKRQRTKYDAAFRTEAVRRVNQDGQAATRVAQALGMSEAVLGKWVRAARAQVTRPAGLRHPCRPLWSTPAARPTATRRPCSGPAAAARLAQRQWLTCPLHPGRHPSPAHYPGRPASSDCRQQASQLARRHGP
ncbi:MAG: hypothetical protein EOO36_20755 [Cytophagaceae bacterium]|nr:MAG: hypothetical protein EOO36_20755 [Cytophagaceae bacterium]